MAGARDHADEDADFGVPPDWRIARGPGLDTRRPPPPARQRSGRSSCAAARGTESDHRGFRGTPWGRSIAGAIALSDAGVGGSFSDGTQDRLRLKMRQLTNGGLVRTDRRGWLELGTLRRTNIALRLVALGYTNVYWYRGGREAWEVNGLPETNLELQDW